MIVVKLLAVWACLSVIVLLVSWHQRRVHARASAVILGLLADGEWWYGLALVKASGDVLKRGIVYVDLDQLEEDGLVESRPEKRRPLAHIGIPRRQYRVTDLGRRAPRERPVVT